MHETHPDTILSWIKRRNASHTNAAGKEVDMDLGRAFLRAQHEEAYKLLLGPVIAYSLNQIATHNKEVRIKNYNYRTT